MANPAPSPGLELLRGNGHPDTWAPPTNQGLYLGQLAENLLTGDVYTLRVVPGADPTLRLNWQWWFEGTGPLYPGRAIKVAAYLTSYAYQGPVVLNGPQVVDFVLAAPGTRVLLTQQAGVGDYSAHVDNGLWVVQAGAWTRPTDYDAATDTAPSMLVAVTAGDFEHDTVYEMTAPHVPASTAITPGVTPTAWRKVSSDTSRRFTVSNDPLVPAQYDNIQDALDQIAFGFGGTYGGTIVVIGQHTWTGTVYSGIRLEGWTGGVGDNLGAEITGTVTLQDHASLVDLSIRGNVVGSAGFRSYQMLRVWVDASFGAGDNPAFKTIGQALLDIRDCFLTNGANQTAHLVEFADSAYGELVNCRFFVQGSGDALRELANTGGGDPLYVRGSRLQGPCTLRKTQVCASQIKAVTATGTGAALEDCEQSTATVPALDGTGTLRLLGSFTTDNPSKAATLTVVTDVTANVTPFAPGTSTGAGGTFTAQTLTDVMRCAGAGAGAAFARTLPLLALCLPGRAFELLNDDVTGGVATPAVFTISPNAADTFRVNDVATTTAVVLMPGDRAAFAPSRVANQWNVQVTRDAGSYGATGTRTRYFGGQTTTMRRITALPDTLGAGDLTACVTVTGVLNLPATPTHNTTYAVHDGANLAVGTPVTVTPAGGDLIDSAVALNAATYLVYNGATATLIYDANVARWIVL